MSVSGVDVGYVVGHLSLSMGHQKRCMSLMSLPVPTLSLRGLENSREIICKEIVVINIGYIGTRWGQGGQA